MMFLDVEFKEYLNEVLLSFFSVFALAVGLILNFRVIIGGALYPCAL